MDKHKEILAAKACYWQREAAHWSRLHRLSDFKASPSGCKLLENRAYASYAQARWYMDKLLGWSGDWPY